MVSHCAAAALGRERLVPPGLRAAFLAMILSACAYLV